MIENLDITSKEFAKNLYEYTHKLSHIAVLEYSPAVNEIIKKKITDDNHIQRTLDGLLDFCFDEDVLYLYRTLCKYYYDVNPQATIDYIDYYKEMYDQKSEKFGKKEEKENI